MARAGVVVSVLGSLSHAMARSNALSRACWALFGTCWVLSGACCAVACAGAQGGAGQDEPPQSPATRPSTPALESETTIPTPNQSQRVSETRATADVAPNVTQGFYALEVPGFEAALVWDPGSHDEALPVWVVAHGAGGNPEWHCQYWSQVVADSAFLLCLRGKPMRAGSSEFYFPEHFTLGRMLDAAVVAFDARYAERRTTRYNGYIGYSQGATMGALMLPERAQRFALVLLSEGGYSQWSTRRARQFAENGGHAVFFACGTQSCHKGATRTLHYFAEHDVPARLGHAPGAGHTPAGPVGEVSVAGLAWLLDQARVAGPGHEQ